MFFPVQGTGGCPTGPDPENSVGDQDIGIPSRPVSSGLQVPGEPGYCRARTRPPRKGGHSQSTCLPARETTYTNTGYAATTILLRKVHILTRDFS